LEADSTAEQARVTVPQRVVQEPGSALAAVNRWPARQASSKLHLLLGRLPLTTCVVWIAPERRPWRDASARAPQAACGTTPSLVC